MFRVEHQIGFATSHRARDLERGRPLFVAPAVANLLRGGQELRPVPALGQFGADVDRGIRYLHDVENVRRKRVEALVMDQSFEHRQGLAFGRVVEIAPTRVPTPVGQEATRAAKCDLGGGAVASQNDAEGFNSGTP